MKDREPLTIGQMQELYRSNPSPEMRELLWEIHRLRGRIADYLAFVECIDREWRWTGAARPIFINMKRCELLNEMQDIEICRTQDGKFT